MDASNYPAVVHVVRLPDNQVEVFSSDVAARAYARSKSGATVAECPVRQSLGEAQLIHERRVHVGDGVVLDDETSSELVFVTLADSWIQEAEVESFQSEDGRWTIAGLGTDRQMVSRLVEDEAAKKANASLV